MKEKVIAGNALVSLPCAYVSHLGGFSVDIKESVHLPQQLRCGGVARHQFNKDTDVTGAALPPHTP